MLNVKDAKFFYDAGANVFEDVSFSVSEGEVFGILGPNGSGKTTLLKCVANLLKLKSGIISIGSKDTRSFTRTALSKKIGFLPQLHVSTYPFNVLDVAVMGRAPHLGLVSAPSEKDIRIAEANLKLLGIFDLADRPYTKLSGGQIQLVLIAMVLTQEPDILLLDEPTSHLDFGNQVRIIETMHMLANKGLSVIFTTHFPNHVFQLSCRCALMNKGRLAAVGEADSVITEENLREIYGIDVKIFYAENAASKVCIPVKNSAPYIPKTQ
jgi:iron complex transport system ATP-binding protein